VEVEVNAEGVGNRKTPTTVEEASLPEIVGGADVRVGKLRVAAAAAEVEHVGSG